MVVLLPSAGKLRSLMPNSAHWLLFIVCWFIGHFVIPKSNIKCFFLQVCPHAATEAFWQPRYSITRVGHKLIRTQNLIGHLLVEWIQDMVAKKTLLTQLCCFMIPSLLNKYKYQYKYQVVYNYRVERKHLSEIFLPRRFKKSL